MPLLATQATYQAGGVCRQVFCNNSKINSHFLLAKLAIPTATRHSRDSIPGKQAENIFHRLAIPAVNHQGKQSEGLPGGTYSTQSKGAKPSGKNQRKRNGWEGMARRGMDTLRTYCHSLVKIPNKLANHSLCFARWHRVPIALLRKV